MNPLTFLYHELLVRPLFNLLIGFINVLPGHSIGIAILLVTLVVRLILLPPSIHQAKHASHQQKKMGDLKDEVKKIKEQHKTDKTKQAEATMRLYREKGINPAAGCLPLLIQLPILIALYRVFLTGVGPESYYLLYSFVQAPANIGESFLGIPMDVPSLLLAVLAGISQFALMHYFSPVPPSAPGVDGDSAQMMMSMQKNMKYIFPAMTVFISLRLPAALALYWVASTLLAGVQQMLIKRWLRVVNVPAL